MYLLIVTSAGSATDRQAARIELGTSRRWAQPCATVLGLVRSHQDREETADLRECAQVKLKNQNLTTLKECATLTFGRYDSRKRHSTDF